MTDSDLLHTEASSTRPNDGPVDPAGDDPLRSSGDPADTFWGAEWDPDDRGPRLARLTGPVARWWRSTTRSVTDGRSRAAAVRTRRDAVDTPDDRADGADSVDGADGALDGWPVEWSEERRRPGVDPLLARLGGLAVVVTLLVPVVLGFASDSGDSNDRLGTSAPPAESGVDRTGLESPLAAPIPGADEGTASTPVAGPSGDSAGSDGSSSIEDGSPSVAEGDIAEALTASEDAATCGADYEVAGGDFWIRIADGAGVEVDELLDVNDATSSTPLYPGRTICLPAGASTPPPPPPAAAASSGSTGSGATSSGSTGSARPATAPAAPTPTVPPTTAPPPPPPPPTTQPPLDAEGVQAVIRAVWPDELEERALEIAWRESNYQPTARNSCCYGVFQIYWNVHRSWLGDLGITSAEQLYDPTLNAQAALVLYQRAGGWGPWGG